MEIHPGIEAIDLALFLKESKTLVICDLHIGYEETLLKEGVLVPRTEFKTVVQRLDYIFSQVSPSQVVINGDLKHEFGRINRQEWNDTIKIIDHIQNSCRNLILLEGNHDPLLVTIARKHKIKLLRKLTIGDILITHGDKVPEKLEKTIIIGHEHPAISLREGAKVEKFKCFLKGKYKRSTLIVQPSFLSLTSGTDVLTQKTISPLITDVSKFEAYILDEKSHKILYFGRVSSLKP